MIHRRWAAAFCAAAACLAQAALADSLVRTPDALRRAVRSAKPGAVIRVAPGRYGGGFYFERLHGGPEPIRITAADPADPPVFNGGGTGLHLAACSGIELDDLIVEGSTDNGINIDDGGRYDAPATGIVCRRLHIRNIGPSGNHDGLKLSGIKGFHVLECTIEFWGTGDGQGIDMVGCHDGVIQGCRFRHTDEEGCVGVQTKGGTTDIVVRGCRFEHAGGRAVNIGGSTGLEFFRPPLKMLAGRPLSEAARITVERNTFIGSGAPVAFVGVDGAVVRNNTIYRPKRWALRILQETTAPGFVPSRKGRFENNIVVFRSDEWAGAVNIGPKTAPETFGFAGNVWYCEDAPARSRPELPTAEKAGVYGKDPLLRDPAHGDLRLQPGSPASRSGANVAH
ncbi:MAG TPA: right-handed parallel beta-helix repeat-containing protein [Chthonomonadaceae bacterium]|nr:right-handed parallel beta-helix repeat-containing protein [Chthonomonadaceae bacterium]